MNLSPDNRTTLETLLAGLRSGVSGSEAAPILAATLQAQQSQQDARKQAYQEMATNVANLASSGMTQGAVSNYVDMMTPRRGIPGRFQGLMDSAYANPDIPQQFMSEAANSPESLASGQMQLTPDMQSQLQSPLYTQNPQNVGVRNQLPYGMNGLPNPSFGNVMTATGQMNQANTMQAMANAPAPPKPTNADQMGQVASILGKLKTAGKSDADIAELIRQSPAEMGVIMDNYTEFAAMFPSLMTQLAPPA